MSIIQEALKKVDNSSHKPDPEPILAQTEFKNENKNIRGKKKTFGASFVLLLVFLALIFFGVKQFADMSSKTNPTYSPAYESIYKPIAKAEASADASTSPTIAAKRKAGFQDFILTGVVELINGPRAIVNNVIVGVGDVINGATVQKIDKEGVVLKKRDSEIRLGME